MKSKIPEISRTRFDFTKYQLPKRKMNRGKAHGKISFIIFYSCFSPFVFDKIVKATGFFNCVQKTITLIYVIIFAFSFESYSNTGTS